MPQYEVNNCSVSTLLSDIKNNEIAIPEIQRPFVWDAPRSGTWSTLSTRAIR